MSNTHHVVHNSNGGWDIKRGGAERSLREKKTNKAKDFPLSDVARKAIVEYLKTRVYEYDEPVFLSKRRMLVKSRCNEIKPTKSLTMPLGRLEYIFISTMKGARS